MPPVPPLPETCDTAFKEWAGICSALCDGRQTIILRKGGIAEGPDGFAPEYPAFWLYPTSAHQQAQGLREGFGQNAEDTPGTVSLGAIAVVTAIHFVDQLEVLDRIETHHVWTSETVRTRFHYRKPGLWVLGVRVFRRQTSWRIPVTDAQLGCKSWVALDESLATGPSVSILDDEDFEKRQRSLSLTLSDSIAVKSEIF